MSHQNTPSFRELQDLQIEKNLSLILLCSAYLNEIVRHESYETVLLCSRDCYYWMKLFNFLANNASIDFIPTYFLTSRRARVLGSSGYLDYVRNALRGRSLVVDLCGTGWSLAILRERAQVDFDILLVHDIGGST
jgi:hypothetical protein